MKKAIYLLSVFFCIIAISACQPTPEKEIVVHKAAEQLEATLVESDDIVHRIPLFAMLCDRQSVHCGL